MQFQRNVLTSFSNERVFSDKKFRFSHALHEAGVANSAYAKQAVSELSPRYKERTTGIDPF